MSDRRRIGPGFIPFSITETRVGLGGEQAPARAGASGCAVRNTVTGPGRPRVHTTGTRGNRKGHAELRQDAQSGSASGLWLV